MFNVDINDIVKKYYSHTPAPGVSLTKYFITTLLREQPQPQQPQQQQQLLQPQPCYFSSDTDTKTDNAGGIPCDDSVSSLIEVDYRILTF
jgi:hypothetical protein